MKDYTVDTMFINSFVKGAIDTLKIQCSIEATPLKPYIRAPGDPSKLSIDIAGLVGITSEKFNGSIAICFPKGTFLAVMEQMLGEPYKEITKDLEDGAGEIMNIVYGTAKRVLNDQGHTLQKALPTVVRGTGVMVRHVGSGTTLVLPFETGKGNFEIEIGVKFEKAAA